MFPAPRFLPALAVQSPVMSNSLTKDASLHTLGFTWLGFFGSDQAPVMAPAGSRAWAQRGSGFCSQGLASMFCGKACLHVGL